MASGCEASEAGNPDREMSIEWGERLFLDAITQCAQFFMACHQIGNRAAPCSNLSKRAAAGHPVKL